MGVPASLESFSGVVPRSVRSAKLSCDINCPKSRRHAPRRVECIVGTRAEELPKPGNRLALRISQSRKEAIERQDPQPSGRVPLETRNQTGQSTQAADDGIVAEEVLRLVELLPPDIRMTLQERPDFPQVTHDAVHYSLSAFRLGLPPTQVVLLVGATHRSSPHLQSLQSSLESTRLPNGMYFRKGTHAWGNGHQGFCKARGTNGICTAQDFCSRGPWMWGRRGRADPQVKP
jgi:hypothetical protein